LRPADENQNRKSGDRGDQTHRTLKRNPID
jgi:hypothetical protein